MNSDSYLRENGDDIDPEWYRLVDAKTGEEIPWSAVELVDTVKRHPGRN